MKKIVFVLPFLFVSTSVLAQAPTVLVNQSRLPIDDVYAAPAGTTGFGDDLTDAVPEGRLDPGKSHQIAPLAAGIYDFLISTPEFKVKCLIKNVSVSGGEVIFTDEQFTVCK